MSILSLFLRKKLFKAKPSPSQSPSEKDMIIVQPGENPYSPEITTAEPTFSPSPSFSESESFSNSPSEQWYGPSVVPSISPYITPSLSPSHLYNTPTKKTQLLKQPKRVEDDFSPSQSTREYKRTVDE